MRFNTLYELHHTVNVLHVCMYVCMYVLQVNMILFHVTFRTSAGDALFPGRRLAELIVELNSLLNSEDVRLFENDM